MASPTASTIAPTDPAAGPDQAGLQTLAGSVVQELRQRGYTLHHIIMLAGELVALACDKVRAAPAARPDSAIPVIANGG